MPPLPILSFWLPNSMVKEIKDRNRKTLRSFSAEVRFLFPYGVVRLPSSSEDIRKLVSVSMPNRDWHPARIRVPPEFHHAVDLFSRRFRGIKPAESDPHSSYSRYGLRSVGVRVALRLALDSLDEIHDPRDNEKSVRIRGMKALYGEWPDEPAPPDCDPDALLATE